MADEEKYSFIEEKIEPSRKRRQRIFLRKFGEVALLACVFGVIAGPVFNMSNHCWENMMHDEDKNSIRFCTPTLEPTQVPTQIPKDESEQEGDVEIIVKKVAPTVEDYRVVYGQLAEVAKKGNCSIVTVFSIFNGVDGFENPTENADAIYGLLIAEDADNLYVLGKVDSISDKNELRVGFTDGTNVMAVQRGYDEDTGIAIFSVPVDKIPEETKKTFQVAELGQSSEISEGLPIIALGNPNGSLYSMDLGIITSVAKDVYITDNKLKLFQTSMIHNESGEGVVIDLEGKVLGTITHKFDDRKNDVVMTFIGIEELKLLIEQLVNQRQRVLVGILGNDITKVYAEKKEVEGGVYVTTVTADTPAFHAGMISGDLITKVEDKKITSMVQFYSVISKYSSEDKIVMEVVRSVNEVNKTIKLKISLKRK